MERRAPLRRTEFRPKTRKPMAARSSKRSAEHEARKLIVGTLVDAGVRCEIGPHLAAAGVPVHCTGAVGGLHERRKRSSAGSTTITENLIPACNWCNGWIEDNPEAARGLFGTWLVLREGDEAWDSVGRRIGIEVSLIVQLRRCPACAYVFVTAGPDGTAPCGHPA